MGLNSCLEFSMVKNSKLLDSLLDKNVAENWILVRFLKDIDQIRDQVPKQVPDHVLDQVGLEVGGRENLSGDKSLLESIGQSEEDWDEAMLKKVFTKNKSDDLFEDETDDLMEAGELSKEDSLVYAGPTHKVFTHNLYVQLTGMTEFKWDILDKARNTLYEGYDFCTEIFTAKLGVSPYTVKICGEMYDFTDIRASNNINVRNQLKASTSNNGFVQTVLNNWQQNNARKCLWFVIYEDDMADSLLVLKDDSINMLHYMKQVLEAFNVIHMNGYCEYYFYFILIVL